MLSLSSATALLEREFARQRTHACLECRVPAPFWAPAPHGMAGLWFLKALAPCPHGCHSLVARIWVELTNVYDIEYSPARSATPKPRRDLKAYSRG